MRKIVLFTFKKLIKLMLLLVTISILSFLLIRFSPIDPIQSYIGADMTLVSPEQRQNIEDYWGLNESKAKQFFQWGKAILQGNLGTSLLYRSPVSQIIIDRFTASFALMALAWVFSGLIGFVFGIIAGMKEGTWIDRIIKGYCFILASTPAFWIGLLLLMFFSVWLGWFPVGMGSPIGVLNEHVTLLDKMKHLILPALTLSIIGVANVALHTRQKLIEVMNSEFIYFAQSKGERGFSLLWRHSLRHILLPAITLQFASFGELFGGAILAEQVFSYPGLGQTVVQAGLGGDVPLLLGIVLCSSVFVFMGNFIADILYTIIDPRIRKEGI